jgi:ferredoxin
MAENCTLCGTCLVICPADAISLGDQAAVIDPEACTGCGACVDYCPEGAVALEERRVVRHRP